MASLPVPAQIEATPSPLPPLDLDPTLPVLPIRNESFGASAPATPPLPPADLQRTPLRYPDTLGTLIEVRKSEGKGYGVFALRDIPPGTILLSESPLVRLLDTGTRADPLEAEVSSLPSHERNAFLSLHHYSRNPFESLNRSIVYTNGYAIMKDMATGVFEIASRINHSCIPNSAYVWKEAAGRIVFWNRFGLLDGEEVTVDYGHSLNYLKRIYGFDCACGGCRVPGSLIASSGSSENEKQAREEMRSIDAVVEEHLHEQREAYETDGISLKVDGQDGHKEKPDAIIYDALEHN